MLLLRRVPKWLNEAKADPDLRQGPMPTGVSAQLPWIPELEPTIQLSVNVNPQSNLCSAIAIKLHYSNFALKDFVTLI